MKQNIYDNNEFFQKYQALRARENNYNRLLEQPNFQALVPDLMERNVLDIGCGSGDFAAFCLSKGASNVKGIDISQNMITAAEEKYSHARLQFEQVAFEDAEVIEGSIDFISSSLAFHYFADFDALIKKISTALCTNGTLLFSMEHPIVTANKEMDSWICDTQGNYLYYALDNYHEEGYRTQTWLVDGVVMYHRTLSTIINTLVINGLQIEKILEPIPTLEATRKLPSIAKEIRRPSFLIIRAKKLPNYI
ncbi:class I SAM-dependent methyltransferase [Solibacillus sp. CAU 1738]|uniref:class I SAM-dependent methyltransferase n=1 Tax=Solibacillus sp. CAU 1738 TaxID=3140363 RepID=UPI003260839F